MANNATEPAYPEWYLAETKGHKIVVTICSMIALSTLFVAARIFTRKWILKTLTGEDYVIVAALISGWVSVGFSCTAIGFGEGRHIAALTEEQISGAVLWTMVGYFPSILSITIPKFAVVMLLVKLLNPGRKHQIFLWTIVCVSSLYIFGCMVIMWAQCTPARAQWDFSIKEKKCWSPWLLVNYGRVASTLTGLVDLYLAVYPAVVLYHLQLNWKKKLALSAALGIGVFSAVTAFYKGSTLWGLASSDFTYDTSDLTMWTTIEGETIIIAACIPVLQPLVDLIRGRRTLSSRKEGSSQAPYYNRDPSKQYHTGQSGRDTELGSYADHSAGAGTAGGGIGGTKRSNYRLRGKDDTDVTMDKCDSQESILAIQAPGRVSNISNDDYEMSHETISSSPPPTPPKSTGGQAEARPTRIGAVVDRQVSLHKSSGSKGTVRGSQTSNSGGIMTTHEIRIEYGGADDLPRGRRNEISRVEKWGAS